MALIEGIESARALSFCFAKIASYIMERSDVFMITFTILTSIILILIALAVVILSIGGATFIAIFADLIVCVFIVMLIMKAVSKAKKRKR